MLLHFRTSRQEVRGYARSVATARNASGQASLYADLDPREAAVLAQFLELPSAFAAIERPNEPGAPSLKDCMDAMHSVGFVEKDERVDGTVVWRVTPKGVVLFRLLCRLQTQS